MLVRNVQNVPLCSLFFVIGWFRVEPVFIIISLLSEQGSLTAPASDFQLMSSFPFIVNVIIIEKTSKKKISVTKS